MRDPDLEFHPGGDQEKIQDEREKVKENGDDPITAPSSGLEFQREQWMGGEKRDKEK